MRCSSPQGVSAAAPAAVECITIRRVKWRPIAGILTAYAYRPRASSISPAMADPGSTQCEDRVAGGVISGVLFAACVVSAVLMMGTGAAAGRGQRSRCAPAHSETVARDRDVRVYSLATKTPGHDGTYACLLHSGRTVALAKPRRYRRDSIGHVVLAGTIVAYTDSTHGVDTGSTRIVVVNLAVRRTLLSIPGVGDFADGCVINFREVTDLVVTDHGSVAWIVRKGANCRTATFEVHSDSASSAQSLLEEGPAILPGSLLASGQTVSWENGGQRRSASLA